MKASTINAGDRVAYSSKWLKSVQAHHLGQLRGVVDRVENGVAYITWGEYGPRAVLIANLVKVDRIHLEPA
jgi:hypothetical protein